MNHTLYISCLLLFLLLPSSVLILRYFKKRLISWWLILLIIPIFSWVMINGVVYFYYEYLSDVISQYGDNCPPELMDEWGADGAKRVVALYFGWVYGILYSLPWLMLYALAIGVRSLIFGRRNKVSTNINPSEVQRSYV